MKAALCGHEWPIIWRAYHLGSGGPALPRTRPLLSITGTRDLLDARHTLVAAISTDWWRATLLGDALARQRLLAPSGLGVDDVWLQK